MTKAEPLKPQEWERFDKWKVVPGGEADDWGIALEGTPFPFMDIAQMVDENDAREIVAAHNAAHAPSGSPPANFAGNIETLKLLKEVMPNATRSKRSQLQPTSDPAGVAHPINTQLGSVASQEAHSPQPHATRSIVELIRDPSITVDSAVDLLIHWIKRQSWASQEAAQPIPSIADVSDHNPNDPSCKACGSAMGWKCLSCGSTAEPRQEAAMPLEQFIKENADFGPLMPSDIQGIARLIRKHEAGTPAKE